MFARMWEVKRTALARLNDCSNKYERHAYRVRRNRHALARSRAAALSCSKHHTLITHSLVCVCASCDRGDVDGKLPLPLRHGIQCEVRRIAPMLRDGKCLREGTICGGKGVRG